jgi:tripartite-type tricarboxylate transporter receptor subunit TctC
MRRLSGQHLRAFLSLPLILALIAGTALAQSSSYPNRTITLVLPFAAGSGTDTTTRIISQYLSAALGVGIVV